MTRSIPRLIGVVLLGIAVAVAIRIAFPQLSAPTSSGDFQLQELTTDIPPAWRLEKLGGGYLASSELNGSVALLYFWTTW